MSAGTDLYQRVILSAADDRSELMRSVWAPTPWMADIYTGSFTRSDDRWQQIASWCTEHIGPESSPIHGAEGQWKFGSATIFGRTWIGFATESQLAAFLEAWPEPHHD